MFVTCTLFKGLSSLDQAPLEADLATEREPQLMTARASQTSGLTNGRGANWAPEVVFSPFRALSTDVHVLLLNQPSV